MIDWKRFQPIKGYALFALEQDESLISAKTGIEIINGQEPMNHFRILRKSDEFPWPLEVNQQVFLRRMTAKEAKSCCLSEKEGVYVLPYAKIAGFYDHAAGGFRPVGKHVLLSRLVGTEMLVGSKIVIPAHIFSKDQTNDAQVLALGCDHAPTATWCKGLQEGDKVVLSKWDASYVELELPQHGYCVIAHIDFISCVKQDDDVLLEPEGAPIVKI